MEYRRSGAYPEKLWRVIQRCTAFDPAQRYQSAEELKAALESITVEDITPYQTARRVEKWQKYGFAAIGIMVLMILVLVLIQTVGQEQRIEPKIDAWVIDADKRTQVGSISWYKNTYKQVADRAYISIETDESPMRAIWSNKFDVGAGWNFPIYFREKNGIAFTIEEVSIAYFSSETLANLRIFDEEILASWWADLVIPANEEKRTNIGFGLQELMGLGVMVKGTDEHGNQLEFHDYIELSQEVVE